MDDFSSFTSDKPKKVTKSDRDSDGEEITSILRNDHFQQCKSKDSKLLELPLHQYD